ncbi:MAG: hypothetical protein HY805_01090 [Nitrospirae bacterium]|nr:hypothetical protein [Nitrospirota bacterium]
MGINEAKKYIAELRKRQGDPYSWPNFLTGLPDNAAVIEKTREIFPLLSKHSIFYMRIANIQPYLIKYGSDRHVDIIQWAAAILKTSADKYNSFIGSFGTHDFVAICTEENAKGFIEEASKTFEKKALSFYSDEDIKKGRLLSFTKEGKKINIGFMKLIFSNISGKTDIPKAQIIPHLERLCSELEKAL